MKKRLLALLLSLTVALGNMGPALASDESLSDASIEEMESVESVENGLLVPLRTKEISESLENFNKKEAKLEIKLNLTSLPVGKVFEDIFGTEAKINILKIKEEKKENEGDFDKLGEITFSKDDESKALDQAINIEDLKADKYFLQLPGKNLLVNIKSLDIKEENLLADLEILSTEKNINVIVKTFDLEGNQVANPTTEATGGKIRFKAGEEEGKFLEKYIDIPKYSEEMQILDEIKAEDFDKINAGFEISFSGLENGVLVDKEANKVYKAEKVLDETEEKATEINFTAGPIITTDENFINNKDYIKVTFNKGEHGKIYENKEAAEEKDSIDFYLYRGIKLEGLLENLVRVKAELPYEFKGRDPELKGSYDAETSHTALYKIADLIPQSGNDKPEGTPKNYVKVEFKAGEGGSFEEGQTTIFWVNPEAEVEIPEPKVKANEGYKFKAWSKELKGKFDKETEITAQFEKTGEQNPEDKLYISYEKKDLLSNGLEQDSGIVIKNLNDKTKITVRYRNGRIPEYRIDEEGRLFVTPGKDVKGPITVIIEDERLEEGKKNICTST